MFTAIYFLFVILLQMLPLSTNIREAYKKGLDVEQFFIQNLALFICTFLKEHQQLIESKVQRAQCAYYNIYKWKKTFGILFTNYMDSVHISDT